MSIISIKNLIHKYVKRDDYGEKVGSVKAVNNVSLEVSYGEFIAILGRNGSGKSTLAKHINALLFPTEGKVYVCDYDTEDEELILDIRKSAGMVFQNPDNQIVATVVEEDVAFGPENMGVEPSQIRLRVNESLEAVGMTPYMESSPNKLSGGQKQRVAIAGVLAMKPKCLIMDEPTAMLDPVGRKEVLEIVHKLNKTEGITVILVTHHMDEVIDADKVLVMEEGKLVLSGTPEEVFSDVERIKHIGLDVPQVTEVSVGLIQAGFDLKQVLHKEELKNDLKCLTERSKAVKSEINTSHIEGPVKDTCSLKNELQGIGENRTPVISLKKVSYTYAPDTTFSHQALNDIDLDIYPGDFLAIIGHTGSGKSTLIQHFNGLEKPSAGTVYFSGEDIHSENYDRKALRGRVGLVFQYPEHQIFEMSIFKDVAFGPKNQGLSEKEVNERVREALELVGIEEERFNDSPLDLSGGQKKRVAIAGVLAMKPEVLILDEPAAGLDPCGRDEILGQIKKIHEKTGITVVLVSHSMEMVAEYANRIVVMNHGEIKYNGSPREIFSHEEELESIGLAVPQVTSLANELAREGIRLNGLPISVEECVGLLTQYLTENTIND